MHIKLFDLNMWMGAYLPELILYVKSNNIDICALQEVTRGTLSKSKSDNFEVLTNELEMTGEKVETHVLESDHESALGNAVLFDNSYRLIKRDTIWHHPFHYLKTFERNRNIVDDPRASISVLLEKEGVQFYVISTHLAWGITPKDEDFKIKQATILYDYIKKCDVPFILAGDFNVSPHTKVVQLLSSLGRNLCIENKITNTLNPSTHYLKSVFPSGISCDNVIIHSSIHVQSFKLIEQPTLSDHLGFMADLIL